MRRKEISLFLVFYFLFNLLIVKAQEKTDTIHITLSELESRFLQQNLQLLAHQYEIAAARAEVITALLYENPVLSYENAIYNTENKGKILDASYNGQNAATLTQLVRLAGKRNKAIRLAQTGALISEYRFYELLRTLKFTHCRQKSSGHGRPVPRRTGFRKRISGSQSRTPAGNSRAA